MSTAVVHRSRLKKKTEPPPRLCFEMAGVRMSTDEFDAVERYDEQYHYELVDGVLVVTPIPLEAQAGPNEFLGYLLLAYQREHPQGSALDDTLPERHVRVRRGRRLADRVIWAGLGRLPNYRKDIPTIAVEFVSSGKRSRQRDYETKQKEYLNAGVTEYWVIDRFQRTLTVFRRKRPHMTTVAESQVYRTPLLPGFELPLARLLAEADRRATAEPDAND